MPASFLASAGAAWLIAGLSLMATVGCGSEVPVVPLCEGSDGLTVRIFAQAGGLDVPGSLVRTENGSPSFAVDGHCQYFMSGGWQGAGSARQWMDEGWRRGTVDQDLRRMLERLVGDEDLSRLNDCDSSPLSDAGPLVFANTRSALVCFGGRSGRVIDMFQALEEKAQGLWELAQPMDQDLHIVAVEGYTADAEPLPRYAWPGPMALRDYSDSAGVRSRIAAADAGPFRAIRERFLRDTRARYSAVSGGMQMTEGDLSAAVFMRDALPYEDERGLWPLPGE